MLGTTRVYPGKVHSVIWRAGTKYVKAKSKPTPITHLNNPAVRKLIGRKIILSIGSIIVSKKNMTKPAKKSVWKPLSYLNPPLISDTIYIDAILMIILRISFFINFIMRKCPRNGKYNIISEFH